MEGSRRKAWLVPSNGANQGDSMDSHFWDILRDIRSLIHKPDDALFIVHFEIRTKPGGKEGQIRFNPYVAEGIS